MKNIEKLREYTLGSDGFHYVCVLNCTSSLDNGFTTWYEKRQVETELLCGERIECTDEALAYVEMGFGIYELHKSFSLEKKRDLLWIALELDDGLCKKLIAEKRIPDSSSATLNKMSEEEVDSLMSYLRFTESLCSAICVYDELSESVEQTVPGRLLCLPEKSAMNLLARFEVEGHEYPYEIYGEYNIAEKKGLNNKMCPLLEIGYLVVEQVRDGKCVPFVLEGCTGAGWKDEMDILGGLLSDMTVGGSVYKVLYLEEELQKVVNFYAGDASLQAEEDVSSLFLRDGAEMPDEVYEAMIANLISDLKEEKIYGIIYEHGDDAYGLWEGFNLSEEDSNAIQQILSKYDTEGCSVRGTRKEIAAEMGADKQFTDDEMYILSDGMLALIKNMNSALELMPESKSDAIIALRELRSTYKELNDKICKIIK